MADKKILDFLECILLLSDGVSQFDLLTKYKFPSKTVIEAKKMLDWIKTNI